METTTTTVDTPKASFEELFWTEVWPVIERVEEQTGEIFDSWYQPIRGELVEEFTDIRWVAVQMLLYWADETGSDFQACFREFVQSCREEANSFKKDNWPLPEGTNTNCPCNHGKPYGACGGDCPLPSSRKAKIRRTLVLAAENAKGQVI
jgi:hypothetical protein